MPLSYMASLGCAFVLPVSLSLFHVLLIISSFDPMFIFLLCIFSLAQTTVIVYTDILMDTCKPCLCVTHLHGCLLGSICNPLL